MSLIAGTVDGLASDVVNSFGSLDVGNQTLNDVFSNMTLMSLLLTTLRNSVVEGGTSFANEYDYIVVGGGTAGCVMASRLSQHPCATVLLLEAGGEQPLLTDVPGFARIFLGTDIDWSYKTTPQKYSSFGQKENRVLWNSGKVLGGGSTLNAMLYARGNKMNYDQWADQGAKGWSYNEVFPYFLKLEDNQNLDEMDAGYHRQGGPMGAEKSKYNSILKKHLTEAMLSLNFSKEDVNGRIPSGIYDIQGTLRNQERCSTSRAYLKPARNRENLHIVTRAFVRKILIRKTRDGRNKAVAVEFQYNNKIHIVRIKSSKSKRSGFGEIILSNGGVRTPQTLMLSGVGPKEQLEKFGIPVIVDLPVGKNLMDHNAAPLLYQYSPLMLNSVEKQISPASITEYALFRTGPLTSISQNTILAFIDGLNSTKTDFPMQELYFFDYSTLDSIRTFNLKEEVEKKVYAPYLLSPCVLCATQLLQPYSRGEVTLNSLDPNDYPDINPNNYADERDIEVVVKGMQVCKAVFEQPAMKKLNAKWVHAQRTDYPGCEGLEDNEYEQLKCLAKSVSVTIWHPSGTAKMGDPSDPTAVVDPQLRVIGVDKLRVVSAAIMPIIPSGNTNVPTMMIAEKAYDMIKDNIPCRSTRTIRGSEEVADED